MKNPIDCQKTYTDSCESCRQCIFNCWEAQCSIFTHWQVLRWL